jgi:hypothetical protein
MDWPTAHQGDPSFPRFDDLIGSGFKKVFVGRARRNTLQALRVHGSASELSDDLDSPDARFSEAEEADRRVPVVQEPSFPTQDRFVALQKWEGQVVEVGANSFTAKLTDLTKPNPNELAEFDLDEVSASDRHLVIPGGVFYWSVGYRDRVSGQRSRESVMRFRRLPRWSPSDRAEADRRAAHWSKALGWGAVV